MSRRGAALALLFGGLVGLAAPSVAQTARLGGQFRYWAFNNHNDLRDLLGYWAQGPLHVQLEYWDFVRGDDVFRPEIGLHLRDRRRSVTTLQWRHERRPPFLRDPTVLFLHRLLPTKLCRRIRPQ